MQQMSSSPARSPLPHWSAPYWLAALVLGGGLALTYALWRSAQDDAQRQLQADFAFRVRELVNRIDSRMQTYVQVLRGVQGLYVSSRFVDRREFGSYVAAQRLALHFPGIHGVGYMLLVPDAQRAAHVAALRREGFAGYAIAPPGQRPLYSPIVYLEPFSGSNVRAFGYDTYSEPSRRAALERARDSGQVAVSARIRLVQENSQDQDRAGFLMVVPDYRGALPLTSVAERRAAIRGWIYAPFRIADLMADIGGEQARGLDLEIYDGDTVAEAARMFDGAAGPAGQLPRHLLQKIRIGGRDWSVLVGAQPGFERALTDKPRLIAWTGAPCSLALAALVAMLARSRRRAQSALHRAGLLALQLREGQASVMALAEATQRSQAMLRSILDSTVDGILVDDLQGTILSANRRFSQLWMAPAASDGGTDGAALFAHLERQLEHAAPLLRQLASTPLELAPEQAQRRQADDGIDILQLKDGRVFEQCVSALQLGSTPARLWTFRDITERKRMHDELRMLASTDFLTGLANRRRFIACLEHEHARLRRDGGASAALLMIDIDHFKAVNDSRGHAAGDAVLRHLAALMRDCQRKIDTPARVGGEEFAVLLPGADLDAAAVFAERLRLCIAATALPYEGAAIAVTVSIGFAALSGREPSHESALLRADQALYRAKRTGRNRIERGDALDETALPDR